MHRRPRPANGKLDLIAGSVVALLACAGVTLIVIALAGAPTPPPRPLAATSAGALLGSSAVMPTAPLGDTTGSPSSVHLRSSVPISIDIRSIDVHAATTPVGVASDGSVQVPPLSRPNLTGWYRLGVTPGAIGNAVIVGHVDSRVNGPAVFYDLGKLKVGAPINVSLRNGNVAEFRVERVALYGKPDLPLAEIYGPSHASGLRLITCGGSFDTRTRHYRSNVVVFAQLARSQPRHVSEIAPPSASLDAPQLRGQARRAV